VIICSFVRIRGTYELTAGHKSRAIGRLYGPDCWLSEPEVFAGKGMEQFWAIADVVCLRVLRQKLVVK